MPASSTASEFKPVFKEGPVGLDGNPITRGWYIGCSGDDSVWTIVEGGPDMYFARKVDCQRAIQGLLEAGVSNDDEMEQIDSEEILRVAYGSLAW